MEKDNTPKLNLRQQKFVQAYVELGNAVKAAEVAGYKRAYACGAMRNPAVRKAISQRRAQVMEPDEILNFLKAVMRGDLDLRSLRAQSAIQLGIRAGLWKNEPQAIMKIEEEIARG